MLILDEPTNHLDIESREALEDALLEFEGAVILVSHDRALLEAVGTRTVVCEDGELRSHMSGWAEYQRDRDEREARERERRRPPRARPATAAGDRRTRPQVPRRTPLRRVATIEREIERAEAELRAVEDELADPAAWASPGRSQRATERHEAAKQGRPGPLRAARGGGGCTQPERAGMTSAPRPDATSAAGASRRS